MRKWVIIFTLIMYLLGLVFLLIHLYVIYKNPEKFDKIPGYEKYRNSKYFWPEYISYGKFEMPEHVLASTSWFIVVLPFVFIYAMDYFLSMESMQSSYTFVFGSPYIIMPLFLVAIIGGFVLSSYLALFSRLPNDISYTIHHMGHEKNRHTKWMKWTLYLLVILVVVCPIHLYSMTNGGYFNEQELVRYRGIDRKSTFQYDEIRVAEVLYDENTDDVIAYVIENQMGEKIDLCDKYFIYLDDADGDLWEYVDSKISEKTG